MRVGPFAVGTSIVAGAALLLASALAGAQADGAAPDPLGELTGGTNVHVVSDAAEVFERAHRRGDQNPADRVEVSRVDGEIVTSARRVWPSAERDGATASSLEPSSTSSGTLSRASRVDIS